MLLGRVIGTVWATRKEQRLEGFRLLMVQAVSLDLKPLSNFVVAVDVVSAGIGELVLVTQGSSARQTMQTNNKPVDAVVVAIVENMDFQSIDVLEKEFEQRKKIIEEQIQKVSET